MTSFEAALSPGLAMETDSNHSYDNAPAISNISERIASLESEQSSMSSGNMIQDIMDETTQFSEPGDTAGDFRTGTRISESSDLISEESKPATTDELPPCVISPKAAAPVVKDQQEIAIVAKTCEDKPAQVETDNTSLTDQQTTINNTSTKVSRSKKSSVPETQSGGKYKFYTFCVIIFGAKHAALLNINPLFAL